MNRVTTMVAQRYRPVAQKLCEMDQGEPQIFTSQQPPQQIRVRAPASHKAMSMSGGFRDFDEGQVHQWALPDWIVFALAEGQGWLYGELEQLAQLGEV